MGWYINLVKNELVVTPEMAADFNKIPSHVGVEVIDGKLFFNRAHLEWMDYVWQKPVLAVLAKHKANGEILFSSSDGDNRGQAWGYRFVNGTCTKLVRVKDKWINDDGLPHTLEPTGHRPNKIASAAPGDEVALAVIAYGTTAYEPAIIGDILPGGIVVVNGYEFPPPDYQVQGDFAAFKIVPYELAEFDQLTNEA